MSPKAEVKAEEQPEIVNLNDSQVDKIEADLVRTSRSYVGSMDSEESEFYQSAALDVKTYSLHTNSSLVGVSQSTTSKNDNSLIIAARAETMDLENSLVGAVYADSITLGENSRAGILVSGSVSGTVIRPVVLLARQVDGPIETTMDTRQVILGSLLAGVSFGLVAWAGQFLFRRRKK
jgi:hypothetical protein